VLERTLEETPAKRKPRWLKEIVQEVERIVAPKGTFKERKRPHRFGGYVALMRSISDVEPASFEEADKLQVWKDAMIEEYKSIIKNNVCDIVARPKDKSVVSSKWIVDVWTTSGRHSLKIIINNIILLIIKYSIYNK
jgi:hypothetical protein